MNHYQAIREADRVWRENNFPTIRSRAGENIPPRHLWKYWLQLHAYFLRH